MVVEVSLGDVDIDDDVGVGGGDGVTIVSPIFMQHE